MREKREEKQGFVVVAGFFLVRLRYPNVQLAHQNTEFYGGVHLLVATLFSVCMASVKRCDRTRRYGQSINKNKAHMKAWSQHQTTDRKKKSNASNENNNN